MMSYLSNASVLEHFHSERQRRLRPMPRSGDSIITTSARRNLRVRIGHALIGAGSTIAGERVEPARPHPHPRAI